MYMYMYKFTGWVLASDFCHVSWFISVVVITSALHAEGPGFNPQMNLPFFFLFFSSVLYIGL